MSNEEYIEEICNLAKNISVNSILRRIYLFIVVILGGGA